jgi:DNA polymerase-3 subunit epsilon
MSKLLVIDTETGGLDPLLYSLLSIGAVVWTDGRPGAAIEVLVAEPEPVVVASAMAINRIDLVAHAQKGLAPADALSVFSAFVVEQFGPELAAGEKVILAGHNVAFDVSFLKRLFRLAEVDFGSIFSHRVLDTASVLRFLSLAGMLPESAIASTEAFKYMKIAIPQADRHTALGDAIATAELLSRLVELTRNEHQIQRKGVAA